MGNPVFIAPPVGRLQPRSRNDVYENMKGLHEDHAD